MHAHSKLQLPLLLFPVLLALAGCDYFRTPQSRVDHAQSLVDEGDYRSALVDLKNALQKQPELPEGRLLLAEVALWLGDAPSADTELGRVPAGFDAPRRADLQYRIDLAMGRHQQVLERLAAGNSPIEPAKQALYRGYALQATNQVAAAEQAFRTAIEADPALLPAHIGLADARATQSDLPGALQITGGLVEKNPEAALAWYAHGVLLARRGDTDEAVRALERASALAPRQLEVLRQIALLTALVEVHLSRGEVEAARANSETLRRVVPGSPITVLMSSRVAMAGNDYVQAATDLRRLVNSAPRFVQARFLLGIALLAQGNLEQASKELNEVVEQAPEHLEARQLLAQARMRLEDPDGALRVLVPALQSTNDSARLTSLTDMARTQASGTQTVEFLERSLAERPDNAALQVQLASAYLQSGEPRKALALLRGSAGAVDQRRVAVLLQASVQAEGLDAARREAQAVASAAAGDQEVLSIVATFHARTGDAEAARGLLNESIARLGEQPLLLFSLAQVEWVAGQPEATRSALQRLLRADPSSQAGKLALAELELARGNRAAAAAQLEALRASSAQAIEPRLLLAGIALTRDDSKQADALIAEVLGVAGSRADVLHSIGLLYLNSGRYDKAIEHLRAGTGKDASNPSLWLNLGRAQAALGQSGPARETLQRALELRHNWVPAEGVLAFLDLQDGDREAARQRLVKLRQLRPEDPEVLALDGEVQMALQQYREAAQSFEAANERAPSGVTAFKAYQARFAGRLPDPVAPLARWVERHPQDAQYRSLLAEAYGRVGEGRRAIQEYEAILRQHPQHVPTLNNLAWLLYEQKDPRAEELARRASSLAPRSAAIVDTFGWILVETGKLQEGLPVLKRAADQAGDNADIQYHYAAALARSGSRVEALALLRKVLDDQAVFASRAAAEVLLAELSKHPTAGG